MTYTIARTRHELQRHNRAIRSRIHRQLGLDPWPPRSAQPLPLADGHGRLEAIAWHPHIGAEVTLWIAVPRENGTRSLFVLLTESDGKPEGWEAELLLAASSAGHVAVGCRPSGRHLPALGVQPATVAAVLVVALCDAVLGRGRRHSALLAGAGKAAAIAIQIAALDDRIRGLILHAPQVDAYPALPKTFAGTPAPFSDLLRMHAPWPLVWCGRMEPAQRHALNSAYRLWDQPDRLHEVNDRTPAGLVALATLTNRNVEGETSVGRRPADPRPPEGVQVAPLNEWIESWSRRRVQLSPPQLEKRSSRRAYMEERLEALASLVGIPAEGTVAVLPPAESVPSGARHEKSAALVLVEEEGQSGSWSRPLLSQFRPLTTVRKLLYSPGSDAAPLVREALRLLEELYGSPGVQYEQLAIVGVGLGGPIALAAAALEPRFSAAVVDACDALYSEDELSLPVLPEILRVGDLPQLAALCAPRPLFIHRAAAGRTGFSSRRFYDWTRRTYQSEQADANLTLQEATAAPDEVFAWLSVAGGAPSGRAIAYKQERENESVSSSTGGTSPEEP